MIYGSDTWYICNRKVLLLNMFLYLSMICYEFFFQYRLWHHRSRHGLFECSRQIAYHDRTTSICLSYFLTLYLIQSIKYMMLVKKQKREVVKAPSSRVRMLQRLWIISVSFSLAITVYIIEAATKFIHLKALCLGYTLDYTLD